MFQNYPMVYRLQDSVNEMTSNVLNITRLWRRPRPSVDKRLDGKTIIVTGSNRGMGKYIATDLAERGARVIMGVRDVESGEKVRDEIFQRNTDRRVDVIVMKLDMGSIPSIEEFVQKIIKSENKLDYVINNAAIMTSNRAKSEQGFDNMMAINYYGIVYLTMKLMDKMLATSSDPRVFLTSSLAQHEPTTPGWTSDLQWPQSIHYTSQYSRTKVALMLFGRELIRRTFSKGLRVYLIDPGVSQTNLFNDIPKLHRIVINGYTTRPLMRSPEESANSMILSVLSDKDTYDPAVYYFSDGQAKVPALGCTNDREAKNLWNETAKTLGLNAMEHL